MIVPAATLAAMPEPAPVLARIAPAVRERLPELVDAVVDRIQATIPVYGEQTAVSTGALRVSAVGNMEYLLGTGTDLAASRRTGRQRALQGVPLPEILAAFRIGFALFWEAVADEAIASGAVSDRELVATATFLWWKADEYAAAVTEAYRDTTAELLRLREQQRSALVEALTTGDLGDRGTVWEIAAKLELPVTGTFAAVAAEVSTIGDEALSGIASKLRAADISSAWRLLPHLHVGVVSLPGADPAALLRVLGAAAAARVGVSPLFPVLEQTPRALHLARIALGAGTAGVHQFDDTPLATLVVAAPETATQIARTVLGGLLALPREDQDTLLDTLEAWLASSGSAAATATRIFCHPNTVRHRLRRITERTGRSLEDPTAVAELSTALHALRLLPGVR
jgi:hypothetical protein